ncbi:unnamed protein product [Ectocarpus sp. 6 AP-2014]
MNPNMTLDNIHAATRLHHRLKNSHCYCGKANIPFLVSVVRISLVGSNVSNRIHVPTVKRGTTEAVFWKAFDSEIPTKVEKYGTHAIRRKTGSVQRISMV